MPRTWFKVEEFRLEWPPYLFYLFVACRLGAGRFISYINIYHIFDGFQTLYHTAFSPVSGWLEFSSLEVEKDRFRDIDEGTWQQHPEILTTKDRWSELLTYVSDVVQSEETNRWKSINTHTHIQSVKSACSMLHLELKTSILPSLKGHDKWHKMNSNNSFKNVWAVALLSCKVH